MVVEAAAGPLVCAVAGAAIIAEAAQAAVKAVV